MDLTLGIYRARTLVEGLSPLILQISKAIVTNENHVLVEELLVEEFEGTVEEFRQVKIFNNYFCHNKLQQFLEIAISKSKAKFSF